MIDKAIVIGRKEWKYNGLNVNIVKMPNEQYGKLLKITRAPYELRGNGITDWSLDIPMVRRSLQLACRELDKILQDHGIENLIYVEAAGSEQTSYEQLLFDEAVQFGILERTGVRYSAQTNTRTFIYHLTK